VQWYNKAISLMYVFIAGVEKKEKLLYIANTLYHMNHMNQSVIWRDIAQWSDSIFTTLFSRAVGE